MCQQDQVRVRPKKVIFILGFPYMGVPQMDGLLFIMENLTKMDDLGAPLSMDGAMGVPIFLGPPPRTSSGN